MLSEILKKIVEESTNEGIRFIEHTTEVFVSYKELYNDAIGLGEWLKEKGMKPGESCYKTAKISLQLFGLV